MASTTRDDAQLVRAARGEDPAAFGLLAERWFDRCWDVAWNILHDRDLAADAAQDALLAAWRRLDGLDRPESFGGWVLRITRNRALDMVRREARTMPTDDASRLEPDTDLTPPIADPVAEYEREQLHRVVWAAAAALGERDSSLLDLHLRHGLEPHELAAELEIAPNAAHQALFRLRKRLAGAIQAWLVWRDGEPRCVVLRAELATAALDTFGPAVVRIVDRHVASCEACAEERDRVVVPAALFSAVPLAIAPPHLKHLRFERLADAGVPVSGGAVSGEAVEGEAGPPEAEPPEAEPPEAGHGGSDSGAGPEVELTPRVDVGGAAVQPTHAARSARGRMPLVIGGVIAVAFALLAAGLAARNGSRTVLQSTLASPPAGPTLTTGPDRAPQTRPDPTGPTPGAPSVETTLPLQAPAPTASTATPATTVPPATTAPAQTTTTGPTQTTTVSTTTSTTAPTQSTTSTRPPPTQPTTTAPTQTTTTTSTTVSTRPPPTPPEPPAPTVGVFEVVVIGACPNRTLLHQVRWSTEHADSVALTGGEGATQVPVSGSAERCAARGTTFQLTATGPGGSVTRTARAG